MPEHEGERFEKGSPGEPPGCAGLRTRAATSAGSPRGQLVRPYTHNPSVCTGEDLPVSLEVQTFQDPAHHHPDRRLSPDHRV